MSAFLFARPAAGSNNLKQTCHLDCFKLVIYGNGEFIRLSGSIFAQNRVLNIWPGLFRLIAIVILMQTIDKNIRKTGGMNEAVE